MNYLEVINRLGYAGNGDPENQSKSKNNILNENWHLLFITLSVVDSFELFEVILKFSTTYINTIHIGFPKKPQFSHTNFYSPQNVALTTYNTLRICLRTETISGHSAVNYGTTAPLCKRCYNGAKILNLLMISGQPC